MASEPPAAKAPSLQLGARLGYGLGTGQVYDGLPVIDGSYGFVPVIVDVGARIIPELYIGVYGGAAHVFARTNPKSCPEGFSCSVNNFRFGLQADWHFLPRTKWDPYVGVNTGYEVLTNHVTGTTTVPTAAGALPANVDATTTERGWEYVGLTFGADIRTSRVFGLGPFLSASLGQYNNRSGTTKLTAQGNTLSETDAPSVNTAMHQLYIIGARGTFNL